MQTFSYDKLIADVLAVTLHLVCLYKSYSQLAMQLARVIIMSSLIGPFQNESAYTVDQVNP